jgi:hypothetical protein
MRLPQWTGYGVATGAMLLIGCSANMVGLAPERVRPAGSLSLFDNPNGYGALVMRVVDERRGYGVQSLADAESYDEVQIRLGGSKITPRLATMSATASHRYQSDKLGMLPPGSDYNLVVSLASQSIVLGGPLLVGQGAVENINVIPGSTQSVTVYINSVGDIKVLSTDYVVSHSSPQVSTPNRMHGFPEVLSTSVITAQASFSQDAAIPPSQRVHHIRLQVTDGLGNVLFQPDGQELASSSATSSVSGSGMAFRAFAVPNFPGNEAIGWLTIYGMNVDPVTQAERVIGSKTRGFLMLKGATLSVDLSPPPAI